jgi:hypothetical protein
LKVDNVKNMFRGWFVGNFEPTLLSTENCEVGYKKYSVGDYEEFHHHRVATEITLIAKGRVKMNGVEYGEGDIIVIEPFEGTDFEALTEVENVVVKIPGATNDKYIGPYKKED